MFTLRCLICHWQVEVWYITKMVTRPLSIHFISVSYTHLGDLSEINPDDIAQIDVLKDASSAAIYGAKAAAGVIRCV